MDNSNHELAELVGTLCNGDLTAADRVGLNALLENDVAARNYYLKNIDAHLKMVEWAELGWPAEISDGEFNDALVAAEVARRSYLSERSEQDVGRITKVFIFCE